MTIVKICGITTYQDAYESAAAGADMLGLNFSKQSPRYIHPDAARELVANLRSVGGDGTPLIVGVFVNESVDNVRTIYRRVGLNAIQLSGDESTEILKELGGKAYKGIQPKDVQSAIDELNYFGDFMPAVDYIPSLLLDAYHPNLRGGTGETVSHEIAIGLRDSVARLMLAGGLTPKNVRQKIEAIRPWGVDVASGVEGGTPGVKDIEKVRAFIVSSKG
jgi:phosphoribosylanthranilate isomerase